MKNYAEQLAYWYLRLNGFFLVSNYVYHQIREDNQKAYNADADLLAIRTPYYYEEIPHFELDEKGNPVIVRVQLESDTWLNGYDERLVGAIVEVKGSDQTRVQAIRTSFSHGRLEVALYRLGVIRDVSGALDVIAEKSKYDFQGGSILKILFSEIPIDGPWMTILLSDADKFIINRMTSAETYLAKSGSRYFFPSELIQYMIWSAKKQERNLRNQVIDREIHDRTMGP
jgi:hypothetical protein